MSSLRNFLTILFIILSPLYCKADFISLIRADQCESIIEIHIEGDVIRLTLEIGEKDLRYFPWITPHNFKDTSSFSLSDLSNFEEFFNHGFTIEADGRKLIGQLQELKKMPRNYRRSLYTNEIDTTNVKTSKMVLFAELSYNINSPKALKFSPPIEKDHQYSSANIGFITYHNKLPVNDLRYLSQTEVLHLDWSDPWYSKFENTNLARHHKSSLMSFLYVDPYEVRHEVLARLKDLEPWLDLGFDIKDQISVEQLNTVKNKIAEFLILRNTVMIDGQIIKPILDKVHFVEVKLSGIQIQQVPEPLSYASAIIGVIFTYPFMEGIPQEVKINWDMWNEPNMVEIPCMMTDPAGPLPYNIRYKTDSVLHWKNYLKNYKLPTVSEVNSQQAVLNLPFLTVLFLGALIIYLVKTRKSKRKKAALWVIPGLLILAFLSLALRVSVPLPYEKTNFSVPESEVLMQDILTNLYRAFDFKEESVVYDKLALSAEGNLLSDIYIQTKKGMMLEEQGGIEVNLKNVQIETIEELDQSSGDDSISFRCQWQVEGDVGHWGHIHRRTNNYDAIITISPKSGSWKLTDIEIIDETRTL